MNTAGRILRLRFDRSRGSKKPSTVWRRKPTSLNKRSQTLFSSSGSPLTAYPPPAGSAEHFFKRFCYRRVMVRISMYSSNAFIEYITMPPTLVNGGLGVSLLLRPVLLELKRRNPCTPWDSD